jgi:hypothetical protein
MLYADEFQRFATTTFSRFLQEARKYQVGTTLAHQLRSQLTSDLQDAVKGAVNIVSFQVLTDDARELAHEFTSHRGVSLPDDLFTWAGQHSDPVIRDAAFKIIVSIPSIQVRYDDEQPDLNYKQKLEFFHRRLRQAVREGNAHATPYPSAYWYGTYDLSHGDYALLSEGFAVLRDRLLATKRLDPDDLANLPKGCAAAKLERPDGSMQQYLLRFPLAITEDHSLIVKTLFDREGPPPQTWPSDLDQASVAAGLRARRIRERNRRLYAPPPPPPPPDPAPVSHHDHDSESTDPLDLLPPPGAMFPSGVPPVRAEVEIDE